MSEHSIPVSDLIIPKSHSGRQRVGSSRAERFATGSSLAATITRNASKQTYYTIRFLVDRPLAADAYRAYAYFRWVDDYLDEKCEARCDRFAFVQRQRQIIAAAYAGEQQGHLTDEERLVTDLIGNDKVQNSGVRAYIDNMMAVMAFDAARRGALISEAELTEYTRWLATAVTEALHHFIGHNCAAPHDETRYLAVTAAHITHMLRDAMEDAEAGYYNLPQAYLASHGIDALDVNSDTYRAWVKDRVKMARHYFQVGRVHMSRIENARRRIAGYAYIARFEVVLGAIERDGYRLRSDYPERKSKRAALKMGWAVLSQVFKPAKFIGN